LDKKSGILILNIIVLLIAFAAIAMSFTGLPGNFDTEPLLAFALLLVAVANIGYMR
jgi:hypothetical protein